MRQLTQSIVSSSNPIVDSVDDTDRGGLLSRLSDASTLAKSTSTVSGGRRAPSYGEERDACMVPHDPDDLTGDDAVPDRGRMHASDLRRGGGLLSRQRPATLWWALFEAAHIASRSGSPDHAYYSAVKDRHDGKLAAISVARQFARRCYHILRNLEPDLVYSIPS